MTNQSEKVAALADEPEQSVSKSLAEFGEMLDEHGEFFAPPTQSRHHRIIIRPDEDGTVEFGMFSDVGPGSCPMSVFHRLAVAIRIPDHAHAPDVIRILQERVEDVERIVELFDGTRWDGKNYVGVWRDVEERDEQEISRELADAIRDNARREMPPQTYIDWISVAVTPEEALERFNGGETWREQVEYDADMGDLILDVQSCAKALEEWATEDQ